MIDQGDELLGRQRFAEARDRYEKAVDLIRENGELPATPLHKIAVSYYYEG